MLSDQRAARRGRGGDAAGGVLRRHAHAPRMFPLSWIIQARPADSPRSSTRTSTASASSSRSPPSAPAPHARARRRAAALGLRLPASDIRAALRPADGTSPRSALALVLLGVGGWLVIDGQLDRSACCVAFNTYILHAAGAVPHARLLHDDGSSAPRASADAHLRDPRRAGRDRRRSPTRSTSRSRAAHVRVPRRALRLPRRHGPTSSTALDLAGRAGRDRRHRRAHRQRQVHRRPPARRASTTSTAGAVLVDGHDVRDVTLRRCARTSAWCSTSRSCSRVGARQHRLRPARRDRWTRSIAAAKAAEAARVHRAPARRLRHGGRRARLHAVGRPAPAHRASPARCSSTRRSWCSTTPPARSTCRSSPRSTPRSSALLAERTTHRDRAPPVDDRARRPRGADRGRQASSPPAPTHELIATEPALREVLAHAEVRRCRRRGPADEDDLRYRMARAGASPARPASPAVCDADARGGWRAS